MQRALIGAADVPLAVAEACGTLALTLQPIAELGKQQLVSDVAVAAWLTEAAARAAVLNVRANARLMKDEVQRVTYLARADHLGGEAQRAVGRALELLQARGV